MSEDVKVGSFKHYWANRLFIHSPGVWESKDEQLRHMSTWFHGASSLIPEIDKLKAERDELAATVVSLRGAVARIAGDAIDVGDYTLADRLRSAISLPSSTQVTRIENLIRAAEEVSDDWEHMRDLRGCMVTINAALATLKGGTE